jgi:hypothetical protein
MKTTIILLAILASLVLAGVATASITYHGYTVKAKLVGGIDASPCSDPKGCVRGVIELSWHSHHRQHLVRCGHPKRLHVVGTYPFAGDRWVNVYACSKNYQWRLPR